MGDGAAREGVLGMTLGEGLEGSGGPEAVAAEFATLNSSWMAAGFSKSQGTPCLTQFPHFGWISSHYEQGNMGKLALRPNRATGGGRHRHTLIFLILHRLHPALDFL